MANSGMPDLTYLQTDALASLDITAAQTADRIEALITDDATLSAPKSTLYPGTGQLFMSTLAASASPGFMSVKALGLNNSNPERKLPNVGALINLFDTETGLPLAIMDGTWITAERTAAISLVAARRLAPPDARCIALIGAGVQARSHLKAFASSFALDRIHVYGRGRENIRACQLLATDLALSSSVCDTPEEAISDADIVISSVPESTELPGFIDAGTLKQNSFSSLVDLARTVIPQSLDAFSQIVVDDLGQERSMKTPMFDTTLMQCDLKTLVSTPVSHVTGRSAFAFRGIAIGDLALASLCYEQALKQNVGVSLPR